MKQAIKYSVYVAAGVGIFEVLRRTGVLKHVGEWLQEQVPDDMKDRARQMGDHVGDMVHQASDRLKQAVATATDSLNRAHTDAAGGANSNGSSGEVITGGGQGVTDRSADPDGASVPHHVGRGVVH